MISLKNFITLLFAAVVVLFTACKKNYTGPQTNTSGIKLIKIGDATNNNQFEYDAASNVSKITVVTDSVPSAYNITYQNGIPSQLQSAQFLNKLTYADGHLVRSEIYNNNAPEVQSMVQFNYSDNGLSEELFYEKDFSSVTLYPWLKFKFEALPNGDISMIEFFLWDRTTGQYNFLGTDRYQYDDHANPVYRVKDFYTLFNYPATPHNVRTITSYDISGAQIGLVNYEYTYNSAGNPVAAKRTQTPAGGFSSVTTLTYTYQ